MPEEKKEYNYAGFWIRFLALIIDGIIIGLIEGFFIGVPKDQIKPDPTASNIVSLVYTLGFWLTLSTTPGKMALKLRIITTDGKKITPASAVLRYVGYIISGIPFALGFIWAGYDPKKQGWHDKIAKTYVIKE